MEGKIISLTDELASKQKFGKVCILVNDKSITSFLIQAENASSSIYWQVLGNLILVNSRHWLKEYLPIVSIFVSSKLIFISFLFSLNASFLICFILFGRETV